jgi:hypothetical protein
MRILRIPFSLFYTITKTYINMKNNSLSVITTVILKLNVFNLGVQR